MSIEIERKFLVKSDEWKLLGEKIFYRQGYLSTIPGRIVRVRTIEEKGYLTIKGLMVELTRNEFEYEIPIEEAKFILENLCEKPIIEKYRNKIKIDDVIWEVDEFIGENKGLVIAEVELKTEDQKIELPSWIGEEVTGDFRYSNSNLTKNPFTKW
ncbi:MAG: CYTH domain-containing protein [Ignavibacteriales bacterium]|nr:CYTH domain-containing protein [Ignavibacteriales bacterium]